MYFLGNLLTLYFQHGQKIVSLNVILALLSLGVCGGDRSYPFAKLSSIWKPVLRGSNENCSPAFIPVLGCFVTSVQFWCKVLRPGCRQQVPWDPAAWESAWVEMSQPHSRQKSSLFLAWLALQRHNKRGHVQKLNEGSQRRAGKG